MSGENKPKNTEGLTAPWKPGQSGNPGGRPKKRRTLAARCRRIVDEHVVDAWLAEVEKRGPDWVACSKLLAAYGYGRPTQAVSVTHYDGMDLLALVQESLPGEADVRPVIDGVARELPSISPTPADPGDE